jgi:hypothetical protein
LKVNDIHGVVTPRDSVGRPNVSGEGVRTMPIIDVKVVENVLTADQKQAIAEGIRDPLRSVPVSSEGTR